MGLASTNLQKKPRLNMIVIFAPLMSHLTWHINAVWLYSYSQISLQQNPRHKTTKVESITISDSWKVTVSHMVDDVQYSKSHKNKPRMLCSNFGSSRVCVSRLNISWKTNNSCSIFKSVINIAFVSTNPTNHFAEVGAFRQSSFIIFLEG